MTTATKTIEINGRTFEVSFDEANDRYTLTGKRGAVYMTMRFQNDPRFMFLVNPMGRGAKAVDPLGRVQLRAIDGTLQAF